MSNKPNEPEPFDGKMIMVYLETLPDEKSIEMTSELLLKSNAKKSGDTRDLSTYPFYSNKHYYSWKYCMDYGFKYSSSGYSKFVKLFFNRNEFSKLIQQSEKVKNPADSNEIEKINKHNIQVMMDLLFPTKMPTEYNFTDSLNEYILTAGKPTISFKAQTSMLTNPLSFSYIPIQGKTYTVLKVTWLNDIMNNPIYRTFFENFIKMNEWKKGARQNIIEKINFLMNRLLKRLFITESSSSENDFMLRINIKYINNKNSVNSDYAKITTIVNNINAQSDKTPINQYNSASKNEFNERVKDLQKQIDELYEIQLVKVDKNNTQTVYLYDISKTQGNVIQLEFGLFKENGFDFIELNNDIISKIYDISIAIDKNIKFIQSNQGGVLQLSKDFLSKISSLLSMSKEAYILYQIFVNYINKEKVNTSLPKDEDIVKELNDNYPNIVDFISSITPISRAARNSSNGELQDMINKYVGNETTEFGFDDLLNRCNVLFVQNKMGLIGELSSDSDRAKYMNTGVVELLNAKPNTPKYEIYVSLQLAEGEFTEPNQCLYREYFLGDKMESWFLNKSPYLEYKNRFILSKEDIDRYVQLSKQNEKSGDIPIVNTITNASSIFRRWFANAPTADSIGQNVQNAIDSSPVASSIQNTANNMIQSTNQFVDPNAILQKSANTISQSVNTISETANRIGQSANNLIAPTVKPEVKGGRYTRIQPRPLHKRKRKTHKNR